MDDDLKHWLAQLKAIHNGDFSPLADIIENLVLERDNARRSVARYRAHTHKQLLTITATAAALHSVKQYLERGASSGLTRTEVLVLVNLALKDRQPNE